MSEDKIFTSDQIESFNAYQQSGVFHPFTCGTKEKHSSPADDEVLVANEDNLSCPSCDFRQFWAHDWMVNWGWKAMVIW